MNNNKDPKEKRGGQSRGRERREEERKRRRREEEKKRRREKRRRENERRRVNNKNNRPQVEELEHEDGLFLLVREGATTLSLFQPHISTNEEELDQEDHLESNHGRKVGNKENLLWMKIEDEMFRPILDLGLI